MSLTEKTPKPVSIWERYPALSEIPKKRFPNHLLIIPDGNRRFAKTQGILPIEGHKLGLEVMIEILRDMHELPISFITLWAFSSDNWKRPQEEVSGLMTLLTEGIRAHIGELHEKKARFVHLGRKDRITEELRITIEEAEKITMENAGQTVCVAIDFGGSDQETRIAQRIFDDISYGFIRGKNDITQDYLESLRDGNGQIPPADLLIRSSGEQRTSDIGWLNGAQTELYFINEKLFPQVSTDDIVDALLDFSKRQRRFGT